MGGVSGKHHVRFGLLRCEPCWASLKTPERSFPLMLPQVSWFRFCVFQFKWEGFWRKAGGIWCWMCVMHKLEARSFDWLMFNQKVRNSSAGKSLTKDLLGVHICPSVTFHWAAFCLFCHYITSALFSSALHKIFCNWLILSGCNQYFYAKSSLAHHVNNPICPFDWAKKRRGRRDCSRSAWNFCLW